MPKIVNRIEIHDPNNDGHVRTREHSNASRELSAAVESGEFTVRVHEVLRGLGEIAFLDPADIFDDAGDVKPLSQIPAHARRCIAALEIQELYDAESRTTYRVKKIKMHDKVRTLELLGKYLKLFVDRVEHSADDSLAQILSRVAAKVEADKARLLESKPEVKP